MKIAILGSLNSPHVVRWATSLSDLKVDVHVLSLHETRKKLSKDVPSHILSHSSPHGYLLNVWEVKSLLRKIKPDLIHSFYSLGYGTLGNFSGYRPHVLSIMGSDIYDDVQNPILKRFVVNNIRKADVVCSTSQTMVNQIEKVAGIHATSIKYTPFGIDVDKFSPANGRIKKNENELVLGTVKLLEEKYGIDILLKAYALFRNKNKEINSKLVIVGDGSKEYELKELSEKLGVSEFCDFKGFRAHSEIPDILRSFDIYVALSRLDSESFGVAILEASSCALPVIVSNVGGLPEVVEESVTGIVVEKENPLEAANAMESLSKDMELRSELGRNGRLRVMEKYNWIQSVDKMLHIYQDLI